MIPGKKIKPQHLTFLIISILFLGVPISYLIYRANNNVASSSKKEDNGSVIEFKPTHIITLSNATDRLAFRNRTLSFSEMKLANSGTIQGNNLNNATYIGVLESNTAVMLIRQEGISYKIRVERGSNTVEGYIAISVNQKPTLASLDHDTKK